MTIALVALSMCLFSHRYGLVLVMEWLMRFDNKYIDLNHYKRQFHLMVSISVNHFISHSKIFLSLVIVYTVSCACLPFIFLYSLMSTAWE